MKKAELTNKIMRRVAKYEGSHTNQDVELWGLSVLIMLGVLVYALVEITGEMAEAGTFDLLSVIISDWEIAKEFGDEMWQMINYDFPWLSVLKVFSSLMLLLILVRLLIKKIIKARKTWNQIKEYFDKGDK